MPDKQMEEQIERENKREGEHTVRKRERDGQINRQVVDRSGKNSQTHFKRPVEPTWEQKTIKPKLSYSLCSPHFKLQTNKQMENSWPGKVKYFQKSYMTQRKMNEF